MTLRRRSPSTVRRRPRSLGWWSSPSRSEARPRVAAGVVIGAGAVYFLEPEHGREHREKVLKLVA
jgi:hypothetical protein